LHLPKVGGGFKAKVSFFNRFPTVPSVIWVAGFDVNGNYIPGTQKQLAIVGSRASFSLYPDGSGGSLYSAGLQDEVSHLGLYEPGNSAYVETSITYESVMPDALTATVSEANLKDGVLVGSEFIVESRPSSSYWDGVALLNLTGSESSSVKVTLVDAETQTPIQTRNLTTVAPGSKSLHVLSDLFPQASSDHYYQIEADPSTPIQVLGLRGTLVSTPPLLVGSKASKVK